jgi:hypothetical protein
MNTLKKLLPALSIASLVAILALALALLNGGIERDEMNRWMLIASVIWFASAPLWIGKQKN